MRGERARLTRVGCPPPPAHVSAQLEAAKKIIEDLLTPKDDENNDWKRSQLRELGNRRACPLHCLSTLSAALPLNTSRASVLGTALGARPLPRSTSISISRARRGASAQE